MSASALQDGIAEASYIFSSWRTRTYFTVILKVKLAFNILRVFKIIHVPYIKLSYHIYVYQQLH